MTRRPTILAALAAALICAAHAAPAQGLPGEVVQAELLPGWRTESGSHMTALRLTLADGWKTYWRAPGEAGIPPQFDWTGSENVAAVAFHWPTPVVFELNGMRTIGYRHELVLPIEITPRRKGAPIRLAAGIELGVCRDICVPVTMAVAAELPDAAGSDPAIRTALASQPAAASSAGMTGARCEVEPIRDGMRVTAHLDIPRAGAEELAVIELAGAEVWVSEATTSREGGRLTSTAEIVPAAAGPFALDRSALRITILGGERAVELQGCPG